MISIFGKKNYLVDLMGGISDIHNHILPGIDDGAANTEESIALLEEFNNLGINQFIATPHVMNDYYKNTPETIHSALESLKNKLDEIPHLKSNKISVSAEYMMDQSFLDLVESNQIIPLKNNMVLVEMSYFQAPINLNEILFKLQTKGYKPVLAHPERYAYYHSKDLEKYKDLKNRGCLFQINALSLSTHYGKNMEIFGNSLLEENMIDFIGTDAHRLQHLDKLKSIKVSKKSLSKLKKIIENNKKIFL